MDRQYPASTRRGILAGLVATLVVSLLLQAKQWLGLMPQVNLVLALGQALGHPSMAAGWIAHFCIGVLAWGVLFPWVDRPLRTPHWFNGMLFASVVWFGVMLLVLPGAGKGLFGERLGLGTPSLTLFEHWVYGFVLGGVYGLLQPARRAAVAGWLQAHRPHRA